jgi:hypothetical protein
MLLNIRNYRINLQDSFNNKGNGISLFDLLGTFFIAYIIEQYINLDSKKKQLYYLSLIPIGIIVHYLIGQETFLSTQLFNFDLNIYKIIVLLLVYLMITTLL